MMGTSKMKAKSWDHENKNEDDLKNADDLENKDYPKRRRTKKSRLTTDGTNGLFVKFYPFWWGSFLYDKNW